MFSSRDPDELKDLVAKLGPLAHAGTVAQAIAYGDVMFIAVPYAALPQIGADYKDALKGKVMLDACNAVPTRDGDAITKEADTNGIGVTSQKYLVGTRLVRAFNTMGAQTFESQSNRPDPKLAIPIAGDDPEAVRVAEGLVRDAGFDPVLAGGLASAKKFQQRSAGAYGFQGSAAELTANARLQMRKLASSGTGDSLFSENRREADESGSIAHSYIVPNRCFPFPKSLGLPIWAVRKKW